MEDADVFIGLSMADIVSPEMLKSMAKNPISEFYRSQQNHAHSFLTFHFGKLIDA